MSKVLRTGFSHFSELIQEQLLSLHFALSASSLMSLTVA